MFDTRFREKINTWPAFVDLFSNLVIILIFLLIVFVFLWTTTSVFNKNTGIKTIAELKQTNAEQNAKIQQMTADEQEATRLLLLARAKIENAENDLQEKDLSIKDLITAYENKVIELQKQDSDKKNLITKYETELSELQKQENKLKETIDNLTSQLNQANVDKQKATELEQERRKLQEQMTIQSAEIQEQMAKLQAALDTAEEKSRNQEIQYLEMSNKLNKALADKVAELQSVSKYQSEFYKAIKLALGDRTTIRQDGDRFIVSSDILFSSGSYKLSNEGKNQLRLISNIIKDMENKIPSDIDWIIRVDGHTDKKPVLPGTRDYKNNTELSLLRATAVANELAHAGVSKRRLIPSGFGDLHPIELGNDAATLQKNRRIELQLTNK